MIGRGLSVDRLAFVLAGGGSLGAIEVGMLEALTVAGIRPDLVVGTSVGAINGAYFAANPTLQGLAKLRAIWQGLARRDVFPWSAVGVLLGVMGARQSLLESAKLRALLERNFADQRLEETSIPCYVTATDALDGTEVLLDRGRIADALIASAAVPVLFAPVEIDGRFLVDGGVASNTPIAAAVSLGATQIIVLPTGFSCAAGQPPRGAVATVLHTFNLLIARQLVADVERFSTCASIVVVPPLCPLGISSYDFSHAAGLIDRARAATASWLATDGLTSGGRVPRALKPHHHDAIELRSVETAVEQSALG